MDREIMSKKEAAEFLRISISTLERLMRENKIPYAKINKTRRKVLFLKEDLISWVKRKRVK